ncbi:hypothetical protein V7S43_011138 [Phytophthora oleae]|uniref:Pectate lyase n=1 Tax=Phytophthora oleae TaxID=2107226 RepID=A0ABD3FA18_9STRA
MLNEHGYANKNACVSECSSGQQLEAAVPASVNIDRAAMVLDVNDHRTYEDGIECEEWVSAPMTGDAAVGPPKKVFEQRQLFGAKMTDGTNTYERDEETNIRM